MWLVYRLHGFVTDVRFEPLVTIHRVYMSTGAIQTTQRGATRVGNLHEDEGDLWCKQLVPSQVTSARPRVTGKLPRNPGVLHKSFLRQQIQISLSRIIVKQRKIAEFGNHWDACGQKSEKSLRVAGFLDIYVQFFKLMH